MSHTESKASLRSRSRGESIPPWRKLTHRVVVDTAGGSGQSYGNTYYYMHGCGCGWDKLLGMVHMYVCCASWILGIATGGGGGLEEDKPLN